MKPHVSLNRQNYEPTFSRLFYLIFSVGSRRQWARAKKFDSLRDLVQNATGMAKYSALHELALEHVDGDNETALQLVKEAEHVVSLTADTLSILRNQRLKAQILYKLGRPEKAIKVLMRIPPFPSLGKMKEESLNITNLLGVCYMMIGQFDKALEYYFETSELANKVGDMA